MQILRTAQHHQEQHQPGRSSAKGSPGRESPAAGGGGGGSVGGGSPPIGGGSGPARCCDTGRPLFTDPITGHTVCSCQYDMLGYQRLPTLGMYTAAPYPPEAMAAYFPALGPDQTPFYPSGAVGLDVKESLASGAASWPYPSVYHPYDAAFAGYPFNGYGMDLNGARRKNATRETTSTLKAWLNEHKKNPYPTKGEKIMLAIITKMTLTQVSTWFANARRRLKKENKMTWEPRNRVDDEDNNNDETGSGRKSDDNKDNLDSKDSGTGSSEDGDRGTHRLEFVERAGGGGGGSGSGAGDTGSEWSESRPDSPECLYLHQPNRYSTPPLHQPTPQQPPVSHQPVPQPPVKPRIWSLADMASKEDVRSSGKLPRGLPYPARPHHPELYRGLYGAPDPGLLAETYSRMAAAHSSAVAAAAAAAAAAHPHPHHPFAPLPAPIPTPSSSSSSSSSSEAKQPPPA